MKYDTEANSLLYWLHRVDHFLKLAEAGLCDLLDSSLRRASRWKTREYLNFSAGLAGDDWGRGMHSA